MTPEQTYFDYSYDTTLYALADRDKPVYTNQSPSQLNAEFDHLLFIRELEQADCPYALGKAGFAGFDGIELDINHYLVAEYLNLNYRPLCLVSRYCLWVDRGEYARRRAEIQALADSGAIGVTFLEETDSSLRKTYELGQIPWLWGTYDRAGQQETLQILSETADDLWAGSRVTPTEVAGTFTYELRDNQFPQGGTNPRVAVWCSSVGAQDDLIWYPLENSDGTYSVTFSAADHLNQSGEYQFHTYYDDAAGTPQLFSGISASIAEDLTLTSNAGCQYDYQLIPATLDRSDGNYLEITAATAAGGRASAQLLDKRGNPLCTMNFDLQPGKNRYLLRISSNYLWYTDACARLRLTASEAMDARTVSVLRGDVNYSSMNALQRMVLNGEPRLAAPMERMLVNDAD